MRQVCSSRGCDVFTLLVDVYLSVLETKSMYLFLGGVCSLEVEKGYFLRVSCFWKVECIFEAAWFNCRPQCGMYYFLLCTVEQLGRSKVLCICAALVHCSTDVECVSSLYGGKKKSSYTFSGSGPGF